MASDDTLRARKQGYERRWEQLKQERTTWVDHWREVAEQVRPRGSRFLSADRNQGVKVNGKIINGTPTFAARTLAAGMMAGVTSPSRPWFRLTTPDAATAELEAVKQWLFIVERRMQLVFARSNLYGALHSIYSDLGVHGTACIHIDEDDQKVIRAYVFPIGQYCLALNERGEVDTVYREVSLTVRQLVRRFGIERVSTATARLHASGQLETWVLCLHLIEPNEDHKAGMLGPAGKPFRSVWMEQGADATALLAEGGYEEIPFCAPRWNVTGEDVYGDSPGMTALGDAKALQLLEKRKLQLVDKLADPPMRGPTSLRGTRASLLPGDITYVDQSGPGASFAPAFEVNPRAPAEVGLEIRQHEERVNRSFYADLWLMLSQADGTMTAREVVERREEKLLQLGPVLERLEPELLDPMMDRTFAIMLRRGLIPPPPEELQGQDIKIDFISILAQAQKLLGTTGIERASTFVANLAAIKPDVLDKVDWDQTIDEYSTMLGVPPVMIRPDDQVAQIRAARAKAQQQQQQLAAAQQTADVAATAASADTSGDNGLTTMLRGLGAA